MSILTFVFVVSGVFAGDSAGSIDRKAVEVLTEMDACLAEVEE